MLIDRTFGTHYHAFYGDSELVIGLDPVRVIQGDAPSWVRHWALKWVSRYESESQADWKIDWRLPTPISRQAANHTAFKPTLAWSETRAFQAMRWV